MVRRPTPNVIRRFSLRLEKNVCKQLTSLLVSRVSCLSPWPRQNFPAALKIEQTLSLVKKLLYLNYSFIIKHEVYFLSLGAPTSPTMISEPKTLVEDKLMLNEEKFVCEATVGYPRAGSIILQTNRGNGNFEKLLEGNSEIQPATDNCGTNKTLTVKGLTFDAAWNNTQVRCAVEDDEGIIIETDSKTFTIQLLPGNFICIH